MINKDYLIAIDLGYGQVKGINEDGKKVIFPSIISFGKDRSIDRVFNNVKNRIMENLHVTVDFGSGSAEDYFLGDLAKNQLVNSSFLNKENKINSEESKVFLAAAVALLMPNIISSDRSIHISTGLPLEHFVKQNKEFNEMLNAFRCTVDMPDQSIRKKISFGRITQFPQGGGAIYNAMFLNPAKYLIAETYVALIDVGFITTNVVVFRISNREEFVFEFDHSMSITLDNMGMYGIMSIMDKEFTDQSKDGDKLNIAQLTTLNEIGSIFFKGKVINLSKQLKAARKNLATTIINQLDSTWGTKKNSFSSIMVSGGGGLVLFPYLKEIQPNITELIADPVMANAIGYLKYAQR